MSDRSLYEGSYGSTSGGGKAHQVCQREGCSFFATIAMRREQPDFLYFCKSHGAQFREMRLGENHPIQERRQVKI